MRSSSLDVKRATVVANPTYGGLPPPDGQEDPETGLDDLNLGMNYDQIMLYFDNLKESNA